MPESAPIETDVPAFPRMRGVGADGFVNLDVACRTCGYDLRALSVDAKCPECGTDVLGSLRSEQLSYADPMWLHTLSLGAQWIAWTLLAQATLTRLLFPSYPREYSVVGLVQVFALGPWLIGVYLLTRPDPTGRGELEYGALRRAWLFAALGVAVVDSIHAIGLTLNWAPAPPMWIARMVAYAICAFIGFRYLANFGMRLHGDLLRTYATSLSISFPLCYLALTCAIIFDGVRTPVWILSGIGLYLISQIVYLKLLRSFGVRLQRQRGWRTINQETK